MGIALKNPDTDTPMISVTFDSLHLPSLRTDPIRSTYSSTHFGIPDLGMSKYLFGEEEEEEDNEFLRRWLTAMSFQNSTHLGILPPAPASRLHCENSDREPIDFEFFSPRDRCFLSVCGSESELRRSKKSERSSPHRKIQLSSTKN